MLSEKEKQFIDYWEKNRVFESSFASKLLRGFPMALLFSLPIVLFVVAIWLFFPDWYMKISKTSTGTFITVIFAVFIIAGFFGWFRMHYKWEQNEEYYTILKKRAKNENQTP